GIALGALGLAGHYLVNGSQDQAAELKQKCDELARIPAGRQAAFRPTIWEDTFWLKGYSQLGWIEIPEFSGQVARGDRLTAARTEDGQLQLLREKRVVIED
ncbi:hypothetical protein FOL47_001000, partial [Perkinsus chesapeaki]